MDVLVTGSSGFIGSALMPALADAGYRPIRALRGSFVPKGVDAIAWDPDAGTIDTASLEGLGAVVHLAGVGIGDKKWTDARKRLVLESRTTSTTLLATALAGLRQRPRVLVSASAVGYYGNRGDEILTEDSGPGDDFLADVCEEWEAATLPAVESGMRVVTIRTGIVLGRGGGVLQRLLTPFKLGIGGRLGDGRQWMSWITMQDEVRAILHAIATETLVGPANLTAPNPVRNAELTATLGEVVHRPTKIPTPLLPLKVLYGAELVQSLLLDGQRALPKALERTGFEFAHPELEAGLRAVLATDDTT